MKQLSSARAGLALRWSYAGGRSVRAYVHRPRAAESACVSTRSAELVVVLDGAIELELGPRAERVTVESGAAVWIPRRLAHRLRSVRDARVIVVDRTDRDPDALSVLPRHAMPVALVRRIASAWDRGAEECFEDAIAASAEIAARAATRPIALETIACTRRMHVAKRILEASFPVAPSLADLARRVGASEHYVLRNFKRHFGFTPLAYVQFLRSEHFFWELLAAEPPAPTLLELSGDAGWDDYSTFERRMRRMTGRAPSALVDVTPDHKLGPE